MNNITVIAIYQDDYSAKTFHRPEFTKLLNVLRKHRGKADLLLFTKWDRFSRNTGDAYGMINTLNKLGLIRKPLNSLWIYLFPKIKSCLHFIWRP